MIKDICSSWKNHCEEDLLKVPGGMCELCNKILELYNDQDKPSHYLRFGFS